MQDRIFPLFESAVKAARFVSFIVRFERSFRGLHKQRGWQCGWQRGRDSLSSQCVSGTLIASEVPEEPRDSAVRDTEGEGLFMCLKHMKNLTDALCV